MQAARYRVFFLRSVMVAFCLTGWSIFADDFSPGLSGEYLLENTYVGEADVSRDHHAVENFDENDSILGLILTPRISLGVLRIGGDWERFSFGFPALTPLPNTLQSTGLVVGLDTQLSDSILVRFEAQPGVYGTNHFSI